MNDWWNKPPVAGEDELKSQAHIGSLEFGYIDHFSYRADPFKNAGPNDDKWPGSMVRQTPADPERVKALRDLFTSQMTQTEISECKLAETRCLSETRSRAGNVVPVSKSKARNRKKAKTSKAARKAQR